MDEELIPALNATDLEWIRDRDTRPHCNLGGVNLGAMSPILGGEVTPPHLLTRQGFQLNGGTIGGELDVASVEHLSRLQGTPHPGAAARAIGDTHMDEEPSLVPLPALDPADAETVPAHLPLKGVVPHTPPQQAPGIASPLLTPEKLPDPKKAKTSHASADAPHFGLNPGESRPLPPSPLVPPVYAGRVAAGATTTRSTPPCL